MRIFFVILMFFLMCIFANAQDEKEQTPSKNLNVTSFEFEYKKECGSPFQESQLYDSRRGKITKILSGNKVIFEQIINNRKEVKGKFTVQLAGIDSESYQKNLKRFLLENILNKEIKVIGNTKNDSDEKFFGILWGAGFGDINQHLLENGMAEFSEPKNFYSVSRFTLCVYQQVVEKAKKEKLGIWAK